MDLYCESGGREEDLLSIIERMPEKQCSAERFAGYEVVAFAVEVGFCDESHDVDDEFRDPVGGCVVLLSA